MQSTEGGLGSGLELVLVLWLGLWLELGLVLLLGLGLENLGVLLRVPTISIASTSVFLYFDLYLNMHYKRNTLCLFHL